MFKNALNYLYEKDNNNVRELNKRTLSYEEEKGICRQQFGFKISLKKIHNLISTTGQKKITRYLISPRPIKNLHLVNLTKNSLMSGTFWKFWLFGDKECTKQYLSPF